MSNKWFALRRQPEETGEEAASRWTGNIQESKIKRRTFKSRKMQHPQFNLDGEAFERPTSNLIQPNLILGVPDAEYATFYPQPHPPPGVPAQDGLIEAQEDNPTPDTDNFWLVLKACASDPKTFHGFESYLCDSDSDSDVPDDVSSDEVTDELSVTENLRPMDITLEPSSRTLTNIQGNRNAPPVLNRNNLPETMNGNSVQLGSFSEAALTKSEPLIEVCNTRPLIDKLVIHPATSGLMNAFATPASVTFMPDEGLTFASALEPALSYGTVQLIHFGLVQSKTVEAL